MGKPLYLVVSDPADGPLGRSATPLGTDPSNTASATRPGRSRNHLSAPLVWVVGRGGLLGRHVEAASTGAELWVPRESVQWDERSAAVGSLMPRDGRVLRVRATSGERPWRVLWCAGSGVVATPPAALADETAIVDGFSGSSAADLETTGARAQRNALLRLLRRRRLCGQPRAAPVRRDLGCSGRRSVRASEAGPGGALHGGRRALLRRPADRPPVQPLWSGPESRQAAGADRPCRSCRATAPADLHLCAARHDPRLPVCLGRRPHGRGGARASRAGAPGRGAPGTITKIFASEIETSVASVLGTWRRILRRPLGSRWRAMPPDSLQPRTLSFRSRIWPELRRQPTPLHLGIDAVRRDQLARLSRAGLGRM